MTDGTRVLVTGGTGTVGRALVRALVAEGRQVVGLARSRSSADAIQALGAQPIRGSVEDTESVEVAAAGCDTLFHAAGVNAFCLRDPAPLFRVNVIGSLSVVGAAARAGVRRVVYTSSAAVLGERTGTVGTESSVHRGSFLSEYERSKFEAERVVLETARSLDVEVVCVNPSSVQGPGRASGTGKILVLFLNGKLRFLVRTRVSLVDIDDCTRGHLLAEAKGKPGERYLLNGAALPIEDALAIVKRLTGVTHGVRFMPACAVMGGAALVDALAHTRGRDAGFCPEMVRTLLHGHVYDGSKAERELGLEYTPVQDTLARTIEWLRAEGLVPPHPNL